MLAVNYICFNNTSVRQSCNGFEVYSAILNCWWYHHVKDIVSCLCEAITCMCHSSSIISDTVHTCIFYHLLLSIVSCSVIAPFTSRVQETMAAFDWVWYNPIKSPGSRLCFIGSFFSKWRWLHFVMASVKMESSSWFFSTLDSITLWLRFCINFSTIDQVFRSLSWAYAKCDLMKSNY